MVVPLQYYPYADEEDSVLYENQWGNASPVETHNLTSEIEKQREKARYGSGSYSNVFRVTIDPDHHDLESVS